MTHPDNQEAVNSYAASDNCLNVVVSGVRMRGRRRQVEMYEWPYNYYLYQADEYGNYHRVLGFALKHGRLVELSPCGEGGGRRLKTTPQLDLEDVRDAIDRAIRTGAR